MSRFDAAPLVFLVTYEFGRFSAGLLPKGARIRAAERSSAHAHF
jgi:hypothetical protein